MLSYQHIYHAGNAADLHKHAILAWVLDYLTAKEKPLSYIETHAGRGLYDLSSAEARKTAEADFGILRAEAKGLLGSDHPFMRALSDVRSRYGKDAYAGSPLISRYFLRSNDNIHLAELHPVEYAALMEVAGNARLYHQNGFEAARALTPPTPRRGLLMVDPSYEVKADYNTIPIFLQSIAKKWNVGILILWYPILNDGRQRHLVSTLRAYFPDALISEIYFLGKDSARNMIGSGMCIINPPWGLAGEVERVEALFAG